MDVMWESNELEIAGRSITYFSGRILLICIFYSRSEFSEVIHVDRSKNRPESTSYIVESFISGAMMLLLKAFV